MRLQYTSSIEFNVGFELKTVDGSVPLPRKTEEEANCIERLQRGRLKLSFCVTIIRAGWQCC